MPDILVRDLDPELKRQIDQRARQHRRSLSDEVKMLIRKGLLETRQERALGTSLRDLVASEYRGNDLVFEDAGSLRQPPDLE